MLFLMVCSSQKTLFAVILKGDHWEDGEVFNPSRFLDNEGKLFEDEQLIPFSIGKRICPGQNLANVEFFLYFTRIIQLFDFHPLDESNLPKETFTSGVASTPTPFHLLFSSRSS